MHPLIYIFAYHVDSTTLANGDYELISDQAVEVSEDPESAVEGLTEAPNQSLENFDTTAPQPYARRQAPDITPTLFTLQPILFISIFALRS
jgi:hypothetical protein